MLPAGHYYPQQSSAPEPVVIFVRRHWFAFASWILLLAVMVIAPLVLLGALLGGGLFPALTQTVRVVIVLGFSAYYLFTLAVFLVAWIDFYLDTTLVTRRRLVDIHQSGLFNHRVSEQSLLRVQDVSVRVEGLLQTFFQMGTVYVETAGEAPNFILKNLPHPHHVANTIMELHNKLVQEGYRIDDVSTDDTLTDGRPHRKM